MLKKKKKKTLTSQSQINAKNSLSIYKKLELQIYHWELTQSQPVIGKWFKILQEVEYVILN